MKKSENKVLLYSVWIGLTFLSVPVSAFVTLSSKHSSLSQRRPWQEENNRHEVYRNGSVYVSTGTREHDRRHDYQPYAHYGPHGQPPQNPSDDDTVYTPVEKPIRSPLSMHTQKLSAMLCDYDDDYQQLQESYQALLSDGNTHGRPYRERITALKQSYDSRHTIFHQTYELLPHTQEMLEAIGIDTTPFKGCEGDHYQLQLQGEAITLLGKVAQLRGENRSCALIQDVTESASQFAAVGTLYNREGHIGEATRILDLCYTVTEFSKAIADGLFDGIRAAGTNGWGSVKHGLKTLAKTVCHPVQAIRTAYHAIHRKADTAIQLAARGADLADRLANQLYADLAEITDFAVCAWDDPALGCEIVGDAFYGVQQELVTTVGMIATTAAAITNLSPHDLRQGTAFITEHGLTLAAHHYTGKLYSALASKAISYAATLSKGAGKKAVAGGKACFEVASRTARNLVHGIAESPTVATVAKQINHITRAAHEIGIFVIKYAHGIPAHPAIVKAIGKTHLKVTEKFLNHIFGLQSTIIHSVEKLSGFHHDYLEELESSGAVKLINKIVCPITGIVKAKVVLPNGVMKDITTTFFPSSWTRQQVIDSIRHALDNIIEGPTLKKGNWAVTGISKTGFKIECFFDVKGKLITTCPLM